ncbi:hypothetical protein BIW11_05769 [Tropilaelaps mercedesae]|uniref:Netrin receptor UNC5 n=1 Tax=Tropilaelaps mercedesae TaxID=418985 RepID=A0A1V9Y0U8_9ACAR|nr:hypothetical protein BIW11_05769 [Tropilaelaps mercedesae]
MFSQQNDYFNVINTEAIPLFISDVSETDFDEDVGGTHHGDGANAFSLLLHELNEGPVIEREPVDTKVTRGESTNGPNNGFICAAKNALSVQVRCSARNLSGAQPVSTVRSTIAVGTAAQLANNNAQQQQTDYNSPGGSLVVPSSTLVDLVDPMTGVRHIEIEATVDERIFDMFKTTEELKNVTTLYCICYAWSSKGHVISRIATIKYTEGATAEKKSPKNLKANISGTRVVSLGEKVLLECPLDRPHSLKFRGFQSENESYRVFWLKNGAEVMLDDNVEIDSKQGSLLILRADSSNEGSYACGIKAGGSNKDHSTVRLGYKIDIHVRSDGSWSSWGSWSECSSRCGRGQRTRSRSCTNPPPRHGGRDCPGDYFVHNECHSRRDCLNGHSTEKDWGDSAPFSATWSQWTAWSECGSDCKKHRQRWCSNGLLAAQSHHAHRVQGSEEGIGHLQRYAATPCSGKNHISANCTGGMCSMRGSKINGFHPQLGPVIPGSEGGYKGLSNNYLQEEGSLLSQEQGFLLSHVGGLEAIAMVIGMALAAIILAFTFLIALRFWPRDCGQADKRQLPSTPHHMATYNTHVPINGEFPTVACEGIATLPPNVAESFSQDLRLKDFSTEGKLETAVTIPLLQKLYTQTTSTPGSVTPTQIRSNSNVNHSRTPSSTEKTHRTDSETQSYSDYGAPGSASEYDLIYDTISDELRISGTNKASVAPYVPNHQIAWMTVGPEGGRVGLDRLSVWLTVPPGAIRHGRREMYIAILGNGERERLVGLDDEQSMLSAVIQCGPVGSPLARPVILSFDHCAHAPAEKWNVHLLSSGTNGELHAQWKKELSLMSTGQDVISKRAYVQMDSRMCHLQTDKLCRFVLVGESSNKSFAAKSLVLLAFLSKISSLSQNDYSVRVYCVEDTKAALQNVYSDERGRSVPLDEPKSMVLHDGGANLCLTLEESSLSDDWEFKPGANQQEIPFSHVWSSRLSLLHCSFVLTSSSHSEPLKLACRVMVFQRGNQSHRQILNLNSNAIYRNTTEMPTQTVHSHLSNTLISRTGGSTVVPAEGFRLTPEVRSRICVLLDPPNPEGSDWRRLAQHLELDGNLTYFASKVSPTACLLDLWEVRHREAGTLTSLLEVLKNIERPDLTATLEKHFGAWV